MTDHEFYDKYGRNLNNQQKTAVFSSEKRVLLLAVPGSGKTTVLVAHLGYMIFCKHINPSDVLTMTFTTSAATEMKERFSKLFGCQYSHNMTFCTINGLCNRIIQYVAKTSGKEPFSLITESESKALLRQIYQKINHEYITETILNDVCCSISYIKNMCLSESEIKDKEFSVQHMDEIFREYNLSLRAMRKMDFDDQLLYAHQLLIKIPDVKQYYQDKFSCICVDEAQDTSKIQHMIIRLLVGDHGNLFMVGDEDQSIYGFRGAYPSALLHFEDDYPGAKVLTMEENYRSKRLIIQAANGFIKKNVFRRDKTIKATRDDGHCVEIIQVQSRDEQYSYLFKILKQCREETAILFRNNDSALPLIDLLERQAIPYCYPRKELSFFSHRIVTDIRNIVRFADDPYNTAIFMDVYYKVGLHITKEMARLACRESISSGNKILDVLLSQSELSSYAKENVVQFRQVLSHVWNRPAYSVLSEIWFALSYQDFVKNRQLDAGKFTTLRILSRQTATCPELFARLDYLSNIMSAGFAESESPIVLSTIHSSKGMEYEHVYLLDIINGQLPLEAENQIEDILQHEEDRRICYVGITRAKNSLHIFKCKDCSSEFVNDLDDIIHGRTGKKSTNVEKTNHSELRINQKKPTVYVPAVVGSSILHTSLGQGVIQAVHGDVVAVWMKDQKKQMMFSWHTLLEKDLLVLDEE